ncbi:helix-turn-helix transcriptional regulator [Pseudomonas sp. BJa5]|uniref:helix-turn-helix transcriptional regulator n=1 Tax=Pseudomonas sp. BJa5 TaxID=2936270 RepID=UPI002559638C|nr:WYL domain-containing protein [Pseudomonas sp. BGr12]MDL2419726.1 WYL domain-containing protein [Pseudomonas sp. BGr12]
MTGTQYTAPDRAERRKAIREILRREARNMATDEIHEALEKWFGPYSSRTTRNDLQALTEPKLVTEIKEGGKDRRARYWRLNRSSLDLVLSPTESMTLSAVFQHAERFGFRVEVGELATLREYAAGSVAAGARRNLLAEGRIRTGTRFTVLHPGNYNPDHLETIQNAMRDDVNLQVVYRPRGAGDVQCTYFLKPLALSYQDSNIYLSAFVDSEEWPAGKAPEAGAPRGKYSSNGPGTLCALMLHRVVSVRTTVATIAEPPGYDPASTEAQRDLVTIHGDGPVDLQLRLSPNLHNRLTENPLCDNQVLTQDRYGWVLACRLEDTQGLRLFLLSNAADIEVLAPARLRAHVRETLDAALALYHREG